MKTLKTIKKSAQKIIVKNLINITDKLRQCDCGTRIDNPASLINEMTHYKKLIIRIRKGN